MICRKLRVHVLVFCVTGALLGSVAASADEVKVMISGAFASAYRALGPQFEQAAGETLVTVWGPAVGTAANAIPVRLARGEWADVLIVVGHALDDQVNAGKVVSGSKVDFARSAIGIAAREGRRSRISARLTHCGVRCSPRSRSSIRTTPMESISAANYSGVSVSSSRWRTGAA